MGAKPVEKEKKVEFKEWFTHIIERAMDTRRGFNPDTLREFEEPAHRKATPRRKLDVAVATRVEHNQELLDPQLQKLLEREPKAVIAAEQLGTLLTNNVNGKKFRYARDWVEA
ncbi:MAG: hypothetical protein ABH842_02855 [Candidatus Micrarchaeota archaeon]